MSLLPLRFLVCFALLCLNFFALESNAQSPDPRMTLVEAKEVNRFARQFAKSLLETKDIEPLIEREFVKDFATRWGDHLPLNTLTFEEIPASRKHKIRQYFVAETNFVYSLFLTQFSKPQPEPADYDIRRILPGSVRSVIRNEPEIWKKIESDTTEIDVNQPGWEVGATLYFDKSLALFQKIGPLMAQHATRVKAGRNQAFRKNISRVIKTYEPFILECSDCYVIP